MIDTQHFIHIRLNNEQKWAKVVGFSEEGKTVQMQTANGETFSMKTEGQDTTLGYPTLREGGHPTYFPHPNQNIATHRA